VAVLVDLAGPKIRLGQLHNDQVHCPRDTTLRLVRGDTSTSPVELVSNYDKLVDELDVGDSIMLADGTVGLVAVGKNSAAITCRVVNEGSVRSRQGINLPGVKLSLPSLTQHDIQCARWAAHQPIDFISLSFVRSRADIRCLRELLGACDCRLPIVAKVEKREALENLEGIVDEADAIMVARGDLGVEIDVTRIPQAQKKIVSLCNQKRKSVIVATQMLDSMQHSRRPTRAEVTDVANAILDGADACMLSGETAIGEYPIDSVQTMNQIMLAAEQMLPGSRTPELEHATGSGVHPITEAVVMGASRIASRLNAKLIVVVSHSGATALALSNQRVTTPCVGVSDRPETIRQMCLMWGITPLPDAPCRDGRQLRQFIDRWGRQDGSLAAGDRVIVVTGSGLIPGAHNLVEVHEVG
jgi:pyruvate kinase